MVDGNEVDDSDDSSRFYMTSNIEILNEWDSSSHKHNVYFLFHKKWCTFLEPDSSAFRHNMDNPSDHIDHSIKIIKNKISKTQMSNVCK